MSALSVTQADIDRVDAAEVEIKNILKEGAVVGVTEEIGPLFDGIAVTDPQIQPLLDMLAAAVVAIVRLHSSGDFPLRLATYAVAGVPAASSHTAALIYVSNGANGNPIVAFSDGSNWLRVDTRGVISAT